MSNDRRTRDRAPDRMDEIAFEFELDNDGAFEMVKSRYGAGVVLDATARIDHPAANYDITITSSTGGGGRWIGVEAGQPLTFRIETSLWQRTEITVLLRTDDACNASGHGTISYSY